MNWRGLILLFVLILSICQAKVLTEKDLEPDMFTLTITGDLNSLKPTTYGYSQYWPFPLEVYDIVMTRGTHQFLPPKYNATEIFAYAAKVNGQLVTTYPGPTLSVLKNMPCYVIYTNNISGTHILPVDTSGPFDMISEFTNEVPVVPHAHGLETQMGPDGQPMGFWTKSGRKGPDFFSLKSESKEPNQAIFRYHNTNQGLFWYHDHTMGMTRLNVYAGLVGFYEIVDPQISSEELNILKIYGDVERKYFVIADKTFQQNGQLYYPEKSDSSDFQFWVPEFFGNTMTVNGKVWPKIILKPKIYRFVFLNGCQSRFLNIYFENNNKKLIFQIFRRDSDFLRSPVTVQEHLLLLGARIEIFLDLTNVKGEVMMRNNANYPYPMGDTPSDLLSKIMRIDIETHQRNLQENTQYPPDFPKTSAVSVEELDLSMVEQNLIPNNPFVAKQTLLSKIQYKMDSYTNKQTLQSLTVLDFMSEIQPNTSLLANSKGIKQKKYTLLDFISSNEKNSLNQLIEIVGDHKVYQPQSQVIANIRRSVNLIKKKVNAEKIALIDSPKNKKKPTNVKITNVAYPRYPEGKPYFTLLSDVQNSQNQLSGVMIDGVPLKMGCKGSVFRTGWVYDFYIINLTMDDHPIHIHLVNFQVIRRFKFDVKKYRSDWEVKNGLLQAGGVIGIPRQLDVRPYTIPKSDSAPNQEEKLFMDVINAPSETVTVARVKFSNHYGKSFPFSINKAKYVWHCHILEHEDNQMMRYFCLQ